MACEGVISGGSVGSQGPPGSGLAQGPGLGSSPGAGQGGSSPTKVECGAPKPASLPTRVRRLTQAEYSSTLQALVGAGVAVPAVEFPPDAALGSFHNAAALLRVTDLLATELGTIAEKLALSATESLVSRLGCDPAQGDEQACVQRFLRELGARAYRRPLGEAELQRLLAVYAQGRKDADVRSGVVLVLQVIFQSPNLLYRTELGARDDASAEVTLTTHEIATQLSYLLGSGPPDAELSRAAVAGELASANGRGAQAERLLQTPAARSAFATFASEWLDIGKLDQLSKDTAMFPAFSAEAARAMQRQTEQRFNAVIFDGDGKLGSLLRGGLLTEPSVLAAHAGSQWSSPTHRGKLIRNQLLCQQIAPPPPGLIVTVPPAAPGVTTRQRMATHASDPSCAACHVLMDPLGFAFEHYDAVGAYRADEGGLTIDASDQLSGETDADGSFDGAESLAERLANSADVRACFAQQWTTFALGAEVDAELACALEPLFAEFRGEKLRLQQLLVGLVRSESFAKRRLAAP